MVISFLPWLSKLSMLSYIMQCQQPIMYQRCADPTKFSLRQSMDPGQSWICSQSASTKFVSGIVKHSPWMSPPPARGHFPWHTAHVAVHCTIRVLWLLIYTHPFNGPFSGTTRVSWYQKGKNQSGFYWSKRQWVAVLSAGPYASLHLAPDR